MPRAFCMCMIACGRELLKVCGMIIHDNIYSRVVSWLKILLPVLALAILSTMFLVARNVDPTQELPFADIDMDAIASEERVGGPEYSAVTQDGAAISLRAESVRPDARRPESFTAQRVRAVLEFPSGDRAEIVANSVHLNNPGETATFSNGVAIETQDGYQLRTGEAVVALDRTSVVSSSPTEAVGPIGRLRANRFSLTGGGGQDRPYILTFKGKVKLVYNPGNR